MAQRRRTKAAGASKPAGVQNEKGTNLHEYVVKGNVNVWNEQDRLRKAGYFARAVSEKMIITSSPNDGDVNAYTRGVKSRKHMHLVQQRKNIKALRKDPAYKARLKAQRIENLKKARAALGKNKKAS